jgi:hypothetical protein
VIGPARDHSVVDTSAHAQCEKEFPYCNEAIFRLVENRFASKRKCIAMTWRPSSASVVGIRSRHP